MQMKAKAATLFAAKRTASSGEPEASGRPVKLVAPFVSSAEFASRAIRSPAGQPASRTAS